MKSFNIEIITPTDTLEILDVLYVRCPSSDGLFGVMPGHREAVIELSIGEIKISKSSKDKYFSTSGGYAEILKDKIQLLVESFEDFSDIDKNRAEHSLKRAKERIKSREPGIDISRAKISLSRAIARLSTLKR